MVALFATGCTKEDPLPPLATTVVTATTTQASPEDLAFAEAETAYRSYKKLQDDLYRDPSNPDLLERLKKFATGVELDSARQTFRDYADEKLTVSGHLSVQEVRMVSTDLDADPPSIWLRACVDATQLNAMDASGKSVISDGEPRMTDNRVLLVQEDSGGWVVARVTNKAVESC